MQSFVACADAHSFLTSISSSRRTTGARAVHIPAIGRAYNQPAYSPLAARVPLTCSSSPIHVSDRPLRDGGRQGLVFQRAFALGAVRTGTGAYGTAYGTVAFLPVPELHDPRIQGRTLTPYHGCELIVHLVRRTDGKVATPQFASCSDEDDWHLVEGAGAHTHWTSDLRPLAPMASRVQLHSKNVWDVMVCCALSVSYQRSEMEFQLLHAGILYDAHGRGMQ